jgi:hypothetical protein
MLVFVPVEDASVDRDAGVLVPYRCGVACVHGLREGFTPDAEGWLAFGPISDESSARRPASRRSGPPAPR